MGQESRVNILLVDDRPENLMALQSVLEELGQNIVLAHSGEEALLHVLKTDFAVILLDVQMPTMNGFDVADTIRSREKSRAIPIIFLTATAKDEPQVSQGYSAGGVDYVTKPFSPAILKAKVRVFIELAQARRELARYAQKQEGHARLSEKKYRSLMEEANDAIFILKKDGIILEVNRRAAQLLGSEPGVVAGRHCRDFAIPAEAGILEQAFASLAVQSYLRLKGVHLHRPGARTVLLEVSMAMVKVEEEENIVVIARDISIQHRLERALRALGETDEILLRAVEESDLLQGICRVILETGGYPRVWVALTGDEQYRLRRVEYGAESTAADILHEGVIAAAIDTNKTQVVRDNASLPDYPCIIALPLSDSGKAFGALVIYARDPDAFDPEEIKLLEKLAANLGYGVTVLRKAVQNKRLEEEKEKMRMQFLQSQKMEAVGRLAGGIAHDFNNLLNVILGYTEMSLEGITPDHRLHNYLDKVRSAALRAADLTRQMLLFSRKQQLQHTEIDLNAVVEELLKMLRRIIGEDIIIETDLYPELWVIVGDRSSIEQAIMNLSVNARDAMPGGGKLTLKACNVLIDQDYCNANAEARLGTFVRLSVTDTGCGMDTAVLSHLFEPFFTTKEAGKGTGLGLSVVYGVVKEHQGWIKVVSEVGKGSTFDIYLPATLGKVGNITPETLSAKDVQGKGERILVVEDSLKIREYTCLVLENNGYSVAGAANVRDALTTFESGQGNFHLVFSDMVLPDGTGLALVEKVLARQPEIKVVIASGYTDQRCDWQTLQEKGWKFLQKPYTMLALLKAMREVLEPRPL